MMILMLMVTLQLVPPALGMLRRVSKVPHDALDVVHGSLCLLVRVNEVGQRVLDGENFFHII
jgi:hypothetical protein